MLRSRRPADGEAPRRPTAPWERLRMPRNADFRASIQKNPGLKLVSLVLAGFLWYSITKTERDAERVIDVPVSLRKVPEELTVTNQPTKGVSITLRGPRTILDNLDDRNSRVQVGLTALQLGDNRIDLAGPMLNPSLPRSIKVVRFDPPSLTLRADRRMLKRLPVKADLNGSPALGYLVAESTVAPELVEVTGPASVLQDLKQIRTETIDLRGVAESIQRNVLLARIDAGLTFVPDVVRVQVRLEEQIATREFTKAPIVVPEGVTHIAPPTVDVTVRGPQRLLHNLTLAPDAVHVDVAGLPPGTHKLPVLVTLPEGLTTVSQTPPEVRVKVGGSS